MSQEIRQSEEALHLVQSLLRKGSDTFAQPTFSSHTAANLAQAIEILVDRRIAVRERELLEAFRKIMEVEHERS